jgi:hypothetical protein
MAKTILDPSSVIANPIGSSWMTLRPSRRTGLIASRVIYDAAACKASTCAAARVCRTRRRQAVAEGWWE